MLHIAFITACIAVLGVCTRQIWCDTRSPTLRESDIDAQLYALDPELAIELGYEPPEVRTPRPGEVIPMRVGEKWVDLGALAHQNAIIIRGNRYDAA